MKNQLIRSLVSLLRPKKSAHRKQRFLIASTTALGDTLWATPAIAALREAHPDTPLSVLTSSIGKEVLRYNPHIDELFVLEGSAFFSLCRLYKTLKQRQFSHIFLFHASQRTVLPFMALLGAEALIGTAGLNKGLDDLLTYPLPLDPTLHEIERRLHIVNQAGAKPTSKELSLYLSETDKRQAHDWIATLSIPKGVRCIALHPGAKDAFKQWPTSHFIELGRRLQKEGGYQLFITGTPAEKTLVEETASALPGSIPAIHLPLRSFAAFLQNMHLLITNDTGVMHVAFALRVPTLALFSPTDPMRCGPLEAKNVTILAKTPTCNPCLRKKCLSPFCLMQIGVEEVYHAAHKLLKTYAP